MSCAAGFGPGASCSTGHGALCDHCPHRCAYCGAEIRAYRLDVDGAAYCSITCNIKRQQFGSLLNERVRQGDKAQGAFWLEEER